VWGGGRARARAIAKEMEGGGGEREKRERERERESDAVSFVRSGKRLLMALVCMWGLAGKPACVCRMLCVPVMFHNIR
jgi:hypothetical protein